MTTFIFSRDECRDLIGLPPERLVGQMFFDLWRTRMQPFNALADGDVMLMFDTSSRRLVWMFRAAAVTKQQYHSIPEALEIIREHFGLVDAELNRYVWRRPPSGWLLAWAVEVITKLDIEMPGFRMTEYGGRNGYVCIDSLPERLRPELPPWRAEDVLSLPAAYTGGIRLAREGSRMIPRQVRRQVWERDQGVCVECGRGPEEVVLHIDHRYPFSRGGTNDTDNLQLLCRDHNLRKGARVMGDLEPPPGVSARTALANRFGLEPTEDLGTLVDAAALDGDDLTALLIDEAAEGDFRAVTRFLDTRPQVADRDLVEVSLAWRLVLGGQHSKANKIATQVLESSNVAARASAALLLSHSAPSAQRAAELLEVAAGSPDTIIRTEARYELAQVAFEAGDSQRAAEHLRYVVEHSDGELRSKAAFELALTRSDRDLEKDDELLRIALTGADEVASAAAGMLAELLLFENTPTATLESLLAIARKSTNRKFGKALGEVERALEASGTTHDD